MSDLFAGFPYKLVLASTSPRRRELLGHLGIPFEVFAPSVHEQQRPQENPRDYSLRNSREKALDVLKRYPSSENVLALGSDTIVVDGDHVLEKPKDAAHAESILKQLSGRQHLVLTAVTLSSRDKSKSFVVTTEVEFKPLSEQEIRYYIGTGECFDKAGAYGIQGIGGFMVTAIRGSYSNVVGLPLVETGNALRLFNNP